MECDGIVSIRAPRNALAKCHGEEVVPEVPAKGERQRNGVADESGKAGGIPRV